MSYVKWDWTTETGSGQPSGFESVRRSPQERHDIDAGYQATSPNYTCDKWLYKVEFACIEPSCFVWLVDFWHAHRGGQFFYFTWPVGLFGLPEELYTADPGGSSPWSSELAPGFGEAMWHLCRFKDDEFPLKRRSSTIENTWATTGAIQIEQV